MRRRTYLALLANASVGVAGCSENRAERETVPVSSRSSTSTVEPSSPPITRTSISSSPTTTDNSTATSEPTGRVSAISPDEHPNLYFNEGEREHLREIVLNQQVPKAGTAYFSHVKGTDPARKPDDMDDLDWPANYREAAPRARRNMKASFDYMLEPSTAKAENLREALGSWTETKPSAWWAHDGQNAGWIQLSLAFMYDLLYNSGSLTPSDRAHFDDWFAWEAEQLIMSNEWWVNRQDREEGRVSVEKEGSLRQDYQNWYMIRIGCGLVCALVSHDQTLVDRGFNSSLPPTFFRSDISEFSPATRDLENLITGSVFPSGYNWDGYHRRYGFDAPDSSYIEAGRPDRGPGQHYHFYSIFPLVFAAEAATHNGVDAFEYGDQAILRTFKRASAWAHDTYRTDVPNENWRQAYWLVYRRHPEDPDIKRVVGQSSPDHDWFRIADKTSFIWGALANQR